MSDNIARETHEIQRYLATYGSAELIQSSLEGETDPQLATIIPVLEDRIGRQTSGTLIDIGCGEGPLLARLADSTTFCDNANWLYVGIDIDKNLSEVQRIARQRRINRRVEVIELDDFYKNWPTYEIPNIIFCRNVLHELDIKKTSSLLFRIAQNFGPRDELILQDLLRLPSGERHNACWEPVELEKCIRAHGFQRIQCTPQRTRSGNFYLNLIAGDRNQEPMSAHESHRHVRECRRGQWVGWATVERAASQRAPGPSRLVETLDLDLQFAALTRQLKNEGVLGADVDDVLARRIRQSEFTKRLEKFVDAGEFVHKPVEEAVRFRERGEQLNILEAFLRSNNRLSVIHGGTGIGKTTLVRHLLANRAYEKIPIVIDGRRSKDVWSFLEQFLSGIGLNLDADALSLIDIPSWDALRAPLGRCLNVLSDKIIIAIDNFEDVLDTNRKIINDGLATLLNYIVSKDGIKIILVCWNEILPSSLLSSAGSLVPTSVRLGRFGTDQTVINILDDHFNRAAARMGDYPERLVTAIDRHPLVATLAGQILNVHGPQMVLDDGFVSELRNKLRAQLWNRLVDEVSRPAVEVASHLRVPVPQVFLEQLVLMASVHRAREADILYSTFDSRWRVLLSLLGVFRLQQVEDLVPISPENDPRTQESVDHDGIADLYWSTYRNDDDPKWIRESHYHRMLANGNDAANIVRLVGKYYFPELIASADYAYIKRHDYKMALQLYQAASEIDKLPEPGLMRRASCLIRTGSRTQGEDEYSKLVAEYPLNRGMRMSHVDALLYLRDFASALKALQLYSLNATDSTWIASQYGRAYLGLDMYPEAEEIFRDLLNKNSSDPYFYVYLARALQQHGAVNDAIEVLRVGVIRFPNNFALLTSLGADLERTRADEEALSILGPIFEMYPDNTRAALAISRIEIRKGAINIAKRVMSRADRHAPPEMRMFLTTARAELMIADGQAAAAVEFLRTELPRDSNLIGIFLESVCHAAPEAADARSRSKILALGASASVPVRLRFNVPVQVNRARVAVLLHDRKLFNEILSNLRKTKINRTEVQRLEELWAEQGAA